VEQEEVDLVVLTMVEVEQEVIVLLFQGDLL
jgi:hypothetical protein